MRYLTSRRGAPSSAPITTPGEHQQPGSGRAIEAASDRGHRRGDRDPVRRRNARLRCRFREEKRCEQRRRAPRRRRARMSARPAGCGTGHGTRCRPNARRPAHQHGRDQRAGPAQEHTHVLEPPRAMVGPVSRANQARRRARTRLTGSRPMVKADQEPETQHAERDSRPREESEGHSAICTSCGPRRERGGTARQSRPASTRSIC